MSVHKPILPYVQCNSTGTPVWVQITVFRRTLGTANPHCNNTFYSWHFRKKKSSRILLERKQRCVPSWEGIWESMNLEDEDLTTFSKLFPLFYPMSFPQPLHPQQLKDSSLVVQHDFWRGLQGAEKIAAAPARVCWHLAEHSSSWLWPTSQDRQQANCLLAAVTSLSHPLPC